MAEQKKTKTPLKKKAKTKAAPTRKTTTKNKTEKTAKPPVRKAAPGKIKAVPTKAGKKKPTPKVSRKVKKGVPEALHAAALKVLDERKAEEVLSFDIRGRSAIADYVIIATGHSGRQLAAIADYLRKAFSEAGAPHVRIEGLPQADWVLIDVGDVLVHLFKPEVRDYYQIEDVWTAREPGKAS